LCKVRQMRVLTLAVLSIGASAWAADKYEMADLQALEKQSSWEELFDHLEDISPSKRDANWNGMAERASSHLLEAQKVDEHTAEGLLAAADRVLQRYRFLKQSKAFMAKRAEVGLKAFGYTYSNYRHSRGDDEWIDKMKEFVTADTVTADLPQQAAKKVQVYLVAYCAWPFWKMAMDRGAVVCKDADFHKSIIAAIDDGVWKAETTDVAQNKCWSDLKAPLLAELDRGKSEGFKKNACPLLRAKSALSTAQTAKCNEDE
jgi:hypothetical protein